MYLLTISFFLFQIKNPKMYEKSIINIYDIRVKYITIVTID